MINLALHFIQSQYGFVTLDEISAWFDKNNITSEHTKINLGKALEAMGAKRGFIKWTKAEPKKGFLYVFLADHNLWQDKEYWGSGCEIYEKDWRR